MDRNARARLRNPPTSQTARLLSSVRLRSSRQQGPLPGMRYDDAAGTDDFASDRMKRSAFNILVAVSLVLCLLTVTMWLRSYGRTDAIRHADKNRTVGRVIMS